MQIKSNYIDIKNKEIFPAKITIENGKIKSIEKIDLPIKIFFADEMRYGLMTNLKRNWNRIGKRTKIAHSIGYANRYLYTAISPVDGDIFNMLGFDDASTKETNIFLEEL